MLGLYPHTEALRQVAVSRFPPSLTLIFLQPFYGFLLSLPWPTHPPSFTPTAGRLLTVLRLGVAPMSISCATLRPQALSTAAHLWNSQELGTDSFCTSRRFGGWDSDRIQNSHSEFSELSGRSRIPSFFLRLSGILTEIEFARLSSTAFIHIMRTMEDTRAEFRTRPARAGPRGSFGTLLDPD